VPGKPDNPPEEGETQIPPNRSNENPGRYWLSWIAKLAVTALLLYLATRSVDLSRLGNRLAEAQAGPAILAFLLLVMAQFIGAARLASVMQALLSRLPVLTAIRYQFIGLFFNSALPSSVGGDAVRIWLLARSGFRVERALSGILIDRSSAVVALLLIVTMAQPFYGELLNSPTLRQSILFVPVVMLLALPGVLMADRLPNALLRFRLIRGLVNLARDARTVYLSGRHAVRIVGMSVLIQLTASIVYYCLATALYVEMPLNTCVILLPIVILVTTLPISIGGWGVREAATVTLFGAAGVDPEGALLVSVAYGISVVIIGIPGGALWLLERKSHTDDGRAARKS
jgi:glycosyltransferase 2 family protein